MIGEHHLRKLRRNVSSNYLGERRSTVKNAKKKKRGMKHHHSVSELGNNRNPVLNKRRRAVLTNHATYTTNYRDTAHDFEIQVKRSTALMKLITKFYLNNIPVAFLRWRAIALVKKSDFAIYVEKTRVLTLLLEKHLKFKREQSLKALYFWRFQTKLKLPFYKKDTMGYRISKIVERDNEMKILKNKTFSETGPTTHFDILIKINNMREIIDNKYKADKRLFFNQLKTYYRMESMIIGSKMPILIRNIRLNKENFYKNVRSSGRAEPDEVQPRQLLEMLDGKNMHENEEYSIENMSKFKNTYFRFYMSKLRNKRRVSKSSSALLLTGVWSQKSPFLKFRETYMCSLFQKNYHKKIYITFLKLVENKKMQAYAQLKRDKYTKMVSDYKRQWAKIWITSLFQERTRKIYDAVLKRLEIHKRLCRLIDQRKVFTEKKRAEESANQKKYDKKFIEGLLEESFTLRMNEIQSTFPGRFMKILMKAERSSQGIKKDLRALLFDTVFYLLCDVIQQVKETQNKKMMKN